MIGCSCCDPVVGSGGGGGGSTATAANVGSGAEVYVTGTSSPFEFRTLTAGSNITLTPSGTAIEIAATGAGLTTHFESATVNFLNSATAYATAWTSAATPMLTGETWTWICEWLHSNYSTSAASSVRNRWQIEGPAAVWTTLEDNLCQNEGQTLNAGDVGSPRSRAYRITASMDNPRLRLQAGMNLFVGGSGNTQNPRIFGIKTS